MRETTRQVVDWKQEITLSRLCQQTFSLYALPNAETDNSQLSQSLHFSPHSHVRLRVKWFLFRTCMQPQITAETFFLRGSINKTLSRSDFVGEQYTIYHLTAMCETDFWPGHVCSTVLASVIVCECVCVSVLPLWKKQYQCRYAHLCLFSTKTWRPHLWSSDEEELLLNCPKRRTECIFPSLVQN